MKILVVDDDDMALAIAKQILHTDGYEVELAESGEAALEILRSNDIQIVITDWNMPKVTGIDICRYLRSSPAVGYTYIILVTIRNSKEDMLQGLTAGADDFISKPFEPGELLVRVRNARRMLAQQAKLLDSEKQFRSMFQGHSAVMLLIEPVSGRILDANAAASQFYGYSEKQLKSISTAEINVIDPNQEVIQRAGALQKQKNYFHFQHKLASGEIREVEAYSTPIDYGGETVLFSIVHDITERKHSEAVQQEALDRIQKIASRVPGMVYQYLLRLDGSSCFPFASEAIKEIYRVTPEEVRKDASKVFANLHQDDHAGVIASIQASASNLSPWQHEYRVKFDDGVIRFLFGNAVPQREPDGSTLWHGFITDITERKQIGKELQAQRDFATQVINTMGQGLTVTDADGRFEFVNLAYARLFGYELADLIGKRPIDVTVSEDQATLAEQGKLRQAGKSGTYETRLRRADGSLAHVLITGVPREQDGQHSGSIAVITDLTEHKRVEDALRWHETLLQLMSNSSPLGFLVVDNRTDNILYFNQRFCEIWGIQHLADRMRAGELKNNDIIPDCLPVLVDVPAFAASCKPLQDENNRVVVEDEIAFTERRTVRRFSTQIRGEDDEYYGRFYMFEDISERKQAEEALIQAHIQLNNMMNSASQVSIIATDVSGVILTFNNGAQRMLGYSAEELVSRQTPAIFHLESDVTARGQELSRELGYPVEGFDVFVAYAKVGRPDEREWTYIRKDGTHLTVNLGVTSIRNDAGQIIGFLGIATDITWRKQAEAELRRAQDELESAHRELQESFAREQALARIDDLTGINNHRSLLQLAEREFDVAMRYRPPLSMMFFDIDHFKQINDTFGHAMGDQALQKMVDVVCSDLRRADVIGRYGGDEFVLLMPHTSAQEALPFAERIHASIAALRLDTDKGPLTLTISIGIAQTIHTTEPGAGSTDTVENLLLRADQALYAAKQAGRNRTVVFDVEQNGAS